MATVKLCGLARQEKRATPSLVNYLPLIRGPDRPGRRTFPPTCPTDRQQYLVHVGLIYRQAPGKYLRHLGAIRFTYKCHLQPPAKKLISQT